MSAFYERVARFYDAETSEKVDDLQLYSELAERYGAPILDVGCGTGRVLIHLAQEGHIVHGVDDSPQMLARLERKLAAFPHLARKITAVKADIFAYQSPQPYRLTLLTYNALMHFHTQEKHMALLRHLHGLTAKDGLLIIDLPNAGEMFASQDNDSPILDRTFIDHDTGNLIMLSAVSHLDRVTQLMRVQWIYDEITEDGTVKRLLVPHVLRYYFEAEIRLLLQLTGFAVEGVYGSTEGEPFEDGSERMIVHAKPV